MHVDYVTTQDTVQGANPGPYPIPQETIKYTPGAQSNSINFLNDLMCPDSKCVYIFYTYSAQTNSINFLIDILHSS